MLSKLRTHPEESYLVERLQSCCLRNGSIKQVHLAGKIEDSGERILRVEKPCRCLVYRVYIQRVVLSRNEMGDLVRQGLPCTKVFRDEDCRRETCERSDT